MKKFQIIVTGLLALMLFFMLSGCAAEGDTRSDSERLGGLLDSLAGEISDDGLNAADVVRYTARFIAWGKESAMSAQEVKTFVQDWLKERSPEMQASIRRWVGEIAASGEDILDKSTQEVKESLEDGSWKDTVQSILDSILESGGVNP